MVPTRMTCPRINTATDRRPNPIRPSSQPASQPPPAPPIFHATHPLTPFSSADSHSGFAAPSHATLPFPLSLVRSAHPRDLSACFSFHHSHPHDHRPPSRSSTSCHYPSCFSLLALSPFSPRLPHPPARVLHPLSPSRSSPLASSLDMPQGLAVSLGLACRLGQPPLLAKRSSKAAGTGKA